jgi:peptidoglycan LD-endopeptidase LytH
VTGGFQPGGNTQAVSHNTIPHRKSRSWRLIAARMARHATAPSSDAIDRRPGVNELFGMLPRISLILLFVLVVPIGAWLAGARDGRGPAPSALADADAGSGAHPRFAEARKDALPSTAALAALRTALAVVPPYQERGRLGPADAAALGYRVALHPGDTLRVTVDRPDIHLHAFHPGDADAAGAAPLARGRGDGLLEWVAESHGEVVVLLHGDGPGALFTARIERSGDLVFPVAGRGPEDVIGHFLDLRDGGRRVHHGVDIAAPRGNPVRAVADGVIERVETTPVGGLTIRLVERRTGRVHYYAHLSGALVEAGQRVAPGQTIGGVGDTGNARNTPPHLHYAVFDGDAILDPMQVLRPAPPALAADTPSVLLGTRARITVEGAAMRATPTRMGPAISLAHDQSVLVLAETDRYFRVRIGDQEGFVARWAVDR